ncbi:hypothetical protein PR003_g20432 [Phytophthora rubi]|nr:hypothetical protein PR003_g20432 [Phytophthora rubi]
MEEQAAKYACGLQLVSSGMSVRKAAKKIGVPTENLRVRVKGEVPVACRRGPMLTYLSPGADQGLLEVIEHRAARGFCVGISELRFLIRHAAIVSAKRPVTPTFPDRSFVQRWSKRHSENISLRKARILDGCRAEASTSEAVHYYYENLVAALDELKLHDRPSQIWNCDETGVCAQGRCQQRVFAPKGMAANVQRSSDRENVTIMGCINAAGGHIPPMYIFAGHRRKVEWMEVAPDGAVCAVTETSNINGSLFMDWLKWFVRKLPAARPQLLILDGHFAHVNYDAVLWAKRHEVHLFALPAHTSHFLQPLDVGIYQPFKSLYEQELEQYPLREGMLPTRDDIAALTKTGIYPPNLSKMLDGLIGNAPPTNEKSLRHHDVVIPHVELLDISKRQRRMLDRQGLNIDALNVVNIAVRNSVTPSTKKRSRGTYVDGKFSGGVLLTHEEMLDALHRKKKAKLDKEQAKMERALAKERAKVEKSLQAMAKQRVKEELAQERVRIKERQAQAKEQAKKQRALDRERLKVERSLQAMRLKEERKRAKEQRKCQNAREQQSPSIVASVIV